MSKEQQIAVIQGTEQLRERWNTGNCRTLYEQAAPAFRSQPLPDWLLVCEQVEKKLGVWQSFTSKRGIICGNSGHPTLSIVCLDGVALFGKDHLEMEIGWILEGRLPRLLFLNFGPNGKGLSPIPPQPQHLLDSPPIWRHG